MSPQGPEMSGPMDLSDIAHRRMRNQRLVGAPFATPDEAVGLLVAVQSQDYAGAKWAVGQRVRGATDAALERAFDSGAILRTHVLRPTWHFVTPADIRWLLKLTAPRVSAAMAYYNRKFELDARTFRRSQSLLAKALEGGRHLTREELTQVLERAGIGCKELRPTLLMMQAELDAVITSGPRRGKQFTYALLDERAPPEKTLARDEGLAVLALRYFASHGPAQIRDFAWWSGLTIADAKAGVAMAR